MKKRDILLIVFCCVTAVCGAAIISVFKQPDSQPSTNLFVYSIANTSSSQESLPPIYEASSTESDLTVMYRLQSYQGHIGVFRGKEEIPFYELNVSITSLPESDQKLLEKGIKVESDEKLRSLLEDYDS